MFHAQGSGSTHLGNGGTLSDVRAVPCLTSREQKHRERGIGTDEALAVAAYRRYTWERRSGKDAPNHRFDAGQGRPKNNPSTCTYDARIVRKIDFERCLTNIGPYFSTILKLYHVDGETQAVVAGATGSSVRTIENDLPKARKALAQALDAAEML